MQLRCILTKHHVTYLVHSRLCTQQDKMLLAWKEVKHNETTYLGKFK